MILSQKGRENLVVQWVIPAVGGAGPASDGAWVQLAGHDAMHSLARIAKNSKGFVWLFLLQFKIKSQWGMGGAMSGTKHALAPQQPSSVPLKALFLPECQPAKTEPIARSRAGRISRVHPFPT
jgi:hypothetical protein